MVEKIPKKESRLTRRQLLITASAVLVNSLIPTIAKAEQRTKNGIAYEVFGNGKPTIMLIHGWSCDRTYWQEQISFLSNHYKVVTVDLGGHGSSAADRDDWSIGSFGTDVKSVADELNLTNIILVGHSMGGPVVVDAAGKLESRVKAVFGVDTLKNPTLAPQNRQMAEQAWSGFRDDFAPKIEAFVRSNFFIETSPPELVDKISKDMAQAVPNVAIEAGIGLSMYDLKAGLDKINNVPITLFNAEEAPTDTEVWQKTYPNSSVIIVPDSGHFIMMEKPVEFNNMLDAEIKRVLNH